MPEGGFDWKAILPWVWENREEVRRQLDRVFSWFRGAAKKQKPGILIVGPGGSGKTTLAKLLAGDYDLLFDATGPYEESIGIGHYSLKDAPGVEIVVPPGQQRRREATWSELHAEIAAGKYRGIILLGSHGFQSLGNISFKDHHLYGGSKDRFLASYLEDRRDRHPATARSAPEAHQRTDLASHTGHKAGSLVAEAIRC